MTIARLAQKLHAYAAYHQFTPPPPSGRGPRPARRISSTPAWRSRYAVFPRLLLVLTGASDARLARRTADLRSLAAADPVLATSSVRAGVTTLDQLRAKGPFAPVFTPVLGPAEQADAWLPTHKAAA